MLIVACLYLACAGAFLYLAESAPELLWHD